MAGRIALVGGDEFRAGCEPTDTAILEASGVKPAGVLVVPTAAAITSPRHLQPRRRLEGQFEEPRRVGNQQEVEVQEQPGIRDSSGVVRPLLPKHEDLGDVLLARSWEHARRNPHESAEKLNRQSNHGRLHALIAPAAARHKIPATSPH